MKRVLVKLAGRQGKMRKPDECIVYPDNGDGTIKIQGDRLIALFDAETGKGVVNYKGSNSKYNHHLSPLAGAEPVEFPPEFVAECKAAQPKSGDEIGPGVRIA